MKKHLLVVLLILALCVTACGFAESGGRGYSFREDYDALDEAAKSLFYVEVYNNEFQCLASASGFICFDEHLFVTNYHVIDIEGAAFLRIWDDDDNRYLIEDIEAVDPDLVQTEIDVCWVKYAGVDPAAYLRKYAGRAPVVHLKDFFGQKSENMYELIGIETRAPKRPDGFEFRPVGYGLQDVPSIVEASEKAGAEWLIVEQDKPSMGFTALESAKKSIDYLRSIGL